MLVSKKWLAEYVNGLPDAKKIADELTMHSFEIEGVEEKEGDQVLDVKVLPNRSHDCFCHRGIAREIATVLDLEFKERQIKGAEKEESETKLEIKIDDAKLCPRYMGKRIENIEIKNSPAWLREKLEVLDERSICNVVDITNFVMLDLGQPMHAFDADKVEGGIHVRNAKKGEKITLLTGEELTLDESVLVIADDISPLAIAGIKGGKKAEVLPETKNIILESANFNPTMVRKTAQKVGIKNNASKRYENEISPELTAPAMDYAIALISKEASTKDTVVYKTEDIYPSKKNDYKVGISLAEVNNLLGTAIAEKEIEEILNRTGWKWNKIKVEEAVKSHIDEVLGKEYKNPSSMQFDAPNAFSCSSLVSYLYTQAGIWMPSISIDKYVFGQPIERSDLKFGDLVFSNTGNGSIRTETVEFAPGTKVPEGVDHVAMFVGEDEILHATKRVGKVVEEKIDDKNLGKIVGYRRITDMNEERFVVTVPNERLDLRMKEDLAEEIGRIYGYDKIKPQIPNTKSKTSGRVNENLEIAQKIRKILVSQGYSEVYNYAFRNKGEIECENPIASDKAFLRDNLTEGIRESLELNFRNAPFLGLQEIKIFEIGTIFKKEGEKVNLGWGIKNKKEIKVEEYSLEEGLKKLSVSGSNISPDIFDLPQQDNVKFRPISPYPFVLRDIAVWTLQETSEKDVLDIILQNAGELLVRYGLFDRFEKEGKISYAFNLVFQSNERTLTDNEINEIMQKITAALNGKNGWQVR